MIASLAIVAAEKNPRAAGGSRLGRRLWRRTGLLRRHLRLHAGAHCPASAAAPLPRIPDGRKYRMMMSRT